MNLNRMDRILSIVGFLMLSSMVLLLFGFTVYHAWILHSLGEVIVLAVMVGLIFEIYCEGRNPSTRIPDKIRAVIRYFTKGISNPGLINSIGSSLIYSDKY